MTPDSFSPEMYQPSGYTRNNLKSNTAVSAGQALYKTVADEDWYLMVPLSEEDTERFRSELEEGDDSFTLLVTSKKTIARLMRRPLSAIMGRKLFAACF